MGVMMEGVWDGRLTSAEREYLDNYNDVISLGFR